MTREEAIALFEKQLTAAQVVLDSGFGSNPGENDSLYRRRKEMAEIALSALRPVTREQVEKVWKGEWILYGGGKNGRGGIWHCTRCEKNYPYKNDFCPHCGAPMTAKAVELVLKRLEELYEG